MNTPGMSLSIAGATGLVGSECLKAIANRSDVANVLMLGRRSSGETVARTTFAQVDFATLKIEPSPVTALTAAFCTLGTTIKTAGSPQAFRAVDHDAVVAFASWAKHHGCPTFVMVSSVGADATSGSFYLRVKGQTEQAVGALGFRTFIVLRPGVLLGQRLESRPGEAVARAVMPVLGKLLMGGFAKYRGIEAKSVAAAMLAAAGIETPGMQIWHNKEIIEHAS
jgi:uncharacterized protein YbjT (DUF2867 family)